MNECWRNCPYSESQGIRFDPVNPKRIGTAAYLRYETYKSAQTVGEYFDIVKADTKFARVDLQNDINKNICRLESSKSVAPIEQPPEPTGLNRLSESSTSIVPTSSRDGLQATSKSGAKDPSPADAPAEILAPPVAPTNPTTANVAERSKETAPTAAPSSHLPVNGSNPKSKEEISKNDLQILQTESKELEPKQGNAKATQPQGPQGLQGPQANKSTREDTRLEDQSLFSLLGDQPKKLEPKKAARKGPKEPKPKETKAKTEKSEKPPQPKPERQERHRKRETKEVKVLQAREFVRDVVLDYIEGQPDPPEKPPSTDGKPGVRREKDSKEPIAQPNRNGFVWVADAGRAGYTHDAKSAQPLLEAAKSTRCDVCGKSCKHERLYLVRCYSRRLPGSVSELKDPRVMRRETYHAGSRCLESLLEQPFVQPRFIRQFRERLLIALEAQSFDDHQWVEPLWRLNDAHGKTFADLLSAELARVIRARGADEETEKEHNEKKLHEIDNFEDREHYRQLRLNREVVTRCKQLRQRLSLSLMVNSQSAKEEYKKASGKAAVPDVLEDLLLIATQNAVTFASLGVRPIPPGPKTKDFGAASPVEAPPAKKAKTQEPSCEVLQPAVDPSAFQSWNTVTTMTPNLAFPVPILSHVPSSTPSVTQLAGQQPQGEQEPWNGTDHVRTTSYEFSGFRRRGLNCTYFTDQAAIINGRRTFWDDSKSFFMYWQSGSKRWAICQRWQHGQDLLKEVQRGRDLGWAYFRSPGVWSEFAEGAWHQVRTTIRQADPPMSLMDQLAKGPELPREITAALHIPSSSLINPLYKNVLPVETLEVDTPPLVMAMPVEPGSADDFLDICTPP